LSFFTQFFFPPSFRVSSVFVFGLLKKKGFSVAGGGFVLFFLYFVLIERARFQETRRFSCGSAAVFIGQFFLLGFVLSVSVRVSTWSVVLPGPFFFFPATSKTCRRLFLRASDALLAVSSSFSPPLSTFPCCPPDYYVLAGCLFRAHLARQVSVGPVPFLLPRSFEFGLLFPCFDGELAV